MTVHTFLAHFIYGEKGLTGQHLLHVDTLHHTIALSPYEKETAGTRFCDGILFVANASFEVCKPQIIAELKAQNIFTLSAHFVHFRNTGVFSAFFLFFGPVFSCIL